MQKNSECQHHDHPHSHGHHHSHDDGAADGSAKIKLLMEYMLEHNREHAAELSDMAGKLREEGLSAAADLADAAVAHFGSGNEKLAEALSVFANQNGGL
jgi:hypothetical protein